MEGYGRDEWQREGREVKGLMGRRKKEKEREEMVMK